MNRSNKFLICMGLISVILLSVQAFGIEDKQIDAAAREIEDNLIAPCCWSQPVSQHYSPAADKIRKEVRAMLVAGKTREQILDYYVGEYGERILAAPRAKGFNLTAYILPWAALIAGAFLLFMLIRKLRTPAPAPSPSQPPDARYAEAVEKEIKDLED